MPTDVDALLRVRHGGGSGGTAGPANIKTTRRRLAMAASILAGLTSFSTVLADFNGAIPDFYSEPGFVPHREYNSDQAVEIDVFNGGLQVEGSP